MITVSPAAVAEITRRLKGLPGSAGLRIFIRGMG